MTASLADRLLQLATEAEQEAEEQLEARDADWCAGYAAGLRKAAALVTEAQDTR